MNDRFGYLRRFVAAPAQIGSVAPSSPFLTRAMLRGIDWSRMRTIVELGAGTGVFTAAIEAARLVEAVRSCRKLGAPMPSADPELYGGADPIELASRLLDDLDALAQAHTLEQHMLQAGLL